jgi:predicted ribosomally synthesized peptide with SipW-like signal peptide
MKKLTILKSAVTILAMVALVVTATGAIFTDSKSIPNNTFATGTLRLTLDKSAGKPFSVSGAYPGYQTNWEYIDILNSGGLPFEAYMYLVRTSGDHALYNALEIDLVDSGWNFIIGDYDDVPIYSGPLNNITNVGNRIQTSDKDPDCGGTPGNDDIRPGWRQRVGQRLRLPLSAGNFVQGKSVTFAEVVDAVQNND